MSDDLDAPAEGPSRSTVLAQGMRILGIAVKEEPRIFGLALLGGASFGILTIGGAYVVGAVVDHVVLPALAGHRVVAGSLTTGAVAIVMLSVLKVLAIFGRRAGAGIMQFRMQARYRRKVTRRYLELPLRWHRRHPTGTLLSNANSDVEATWFPIGPMPFAAGSIVMIIVAVISLFVIDWAFALVGLAIFPALFALNVTYSRRMSPRVSRAQALRAEVSAIAHESFDGAMVVKAMGREASETERFAAKAGELRDAMIRVGRVRGLFDPLLDALPSVGTLAVFIVGAVRLRQGAVTVPDVVSVAFLFTVLAFPVRAIGWVLAEVPRSVVGWNRIQSVLRATGEMAHGDSTVDSAAPAALRFDGVSLGYDGTQVLHDISFDVPPGRTVALVGPTGSGKSTIASLAVRLVDPDAGTIAIDGVALPALSVDGLARAAALVPQIPFVFDDSVRGNVTLDRVGVDDPVVRDAIRLAQAESFVERLPSGLDTVVGERGTSLSGGQRQRLTLARALAGRPRLLVLDDATSAVDPRVEAAILAGLRARSPGGGGTTSILVVAYRRATIALADEVIYLEHGRVVARGTHHELLASVPGYIDLVTAYERADSERRRELAFEEPVSTMDAADSAVVPVIADEYDESGVLA
jgi:ABC-type multidrug transport system fused ATPase/permease subunit